MIIRELVIYLPLTRLRQSCFVLRQGVGYSRLGYACEYIHVGSVVAFHGHSRPQTAIPDSLPILPNFRTGQPWGVIVWEYLS